MRKNVSWRRSITAALRTAAVVLLIPVGLHAQTAGTYWHTAGKQILDSADTPVRIAGVNWFGLESGTFAPHGLWVRNYKEMLDQIKKLGFNTVRLPFSNQLFDPDSKPNGIDFNLNPDLQDLTGLEVMDRIISHAGKIGLKVILDRHRPDASSQSSLWYTSTYPESRWIADWTMLAARYKGDATMVGVDLHNEPRSPACWGCGELSLDWRVAAQRAGNAILAVNPNLLIVIEGVETYADSTYWWGGNLKGVVKAPVLLDIANRAVYSAHDYPSSIFPQPWFADPSYPANLASVWDSFWGFVGRQEIAPVLMGEFGSKLETESDKKWLDSLTNYLGVNGVNWIFWSWNPNSEDTGGLLLNDWSTVDDRKFSKLKPIQSTGAAGQTDQTPADAAQPAPAAPVPAAPAAPSPQGFCSVDYRVSSDWTTGYTAELAVSNLGAGPVNGWTVTWTFPGTETIRDLWNGRFTQTAQRVNVKDADWNSSLPEKAAVAIGFVAEYSGTASVPAEITLNGFPCIRQR
jgi:endoglucanase